MLAKAWLTAVDLVYVTGRGNARYLTCKKSTKYQETSRAFDIKRLTRFVSRAERLTPASIGCACLPLLLSSYL